MTETLAARTLRTYRWSDGEHVTGWFDDDEFDQLGELAFCGAASPCGVPPGWHCDHCGCRSCAVPVPEEEAPAVLHVVPDPPEAGASEHDHPPPEADGEARQWWADPARPRQPASGAARDPRPQRRRPAHPRGPLRHRLRPPRRR